MKLKSQQTLPIRNQKPPAPPDGSANDLACPDKWSARQKLPSQRKGCSPRSKRDVAFDFLGPKCDTDSVADRADAARDAERKLRESQAMEDIDDRLLSELVKH